MIRKAATLVLVVLGLLASPRRVFADYLPGEIVITTDTLLLGIRLGNWLLMGLTLGALIVAACVVFYGVTDATDFPWEAWFSYRARKKEEKNRSKSWYIHCVTLRNTVISLECSFALELAQVYEQLKFVVLVRPCQHQAKLQERYHRLTRRIISLNKEINRVRAGALSVNKRATDTECQTVEKLLKEVLDRYNKLDEEVHAFFLDLNEINEDIERANATLQSERPQLVDALAGTNFVKTTNPDIRVNSLKKLNLI